MPPISLTDGLAMIERTERARRARMIAQLNGAVPPLTSEPDAGLESVLHRKIMEYCDGCWPKWKYRHSRMDRKTREELGVEDFTIFASGGRTFHIEVKRGKEKLRPEQQRWRTELDCLSHKVFVVRNLEEFLDIIK